MNVRVRPFRDEDAAAVSAVQFESFKSYLGDLMELKEPRPAEDWRQHARAATPEAVTETFVGEDEHGEVLGFVTVSMLLSFEYG